MNEEEWKRAIRLSKEEKKAIETLKEVASDDFDTLGDDISPKMAQNILNVIDKQQKEIEEKTTIIMAGAKKVKQLEKEIEREKQYTDFYKDLCNKQQKLINQLLEDMKERANNFAFESEMMWRKIEKAEKLFKEN